MLRHFFLSGGASLQIGRELGRGGEGAVFEIPSRAKQVAKLYHKPIDKKKQDKLTFMATAATPALIEYAAWPQDTLHAARGGPVIGFLMPNALGLEPIHAVYSPAQRKQQRPKVGWDFLLFVARNTAAAFRTLHAQGHVIGDVNHGNVVVRPDSQVMLIDCDSFQVRAGETLHLCGVGVPEFTSPEMQQLGSFERFARTAHQDNFGLALLIFHLLFGGRHPYSGVPQHNGVGDALESDIRGLRYAYARDGLARGFSPPPRSVPLSVVPEVVEAMFHTAFTENGVRGGRPTAAQWVAVLDDLRRRLKKCAAKSIHLYPDHLAKCPWCALEHQGVVYFIDLGAQFAATSSAFVLTKTWAIIEAVLPPPSVPLPDIDAIIVQPQPLPPNVPGKNALLFYRIFAIGIAILIAAAAPQVWFYGVCAGLVGWGIAGSIGSDERGRERARREAALTSAQRAYDTLVEQVQRVAGPEGFRIRRKELVTLRDEYKDLPQAEKRELDMLHATAHERQKQKFLGGFFIAGADIPGVGPARKATLRSFGIETAADISRQGVLQIHGFGNSLASALTAWRTTCEQRFKFNPAIAVSAADQYGVRSKFASRRVALEMELGGGATELRRFIDTASGRAATLMPELERAAERLAQSKKDKTLV